MLQKIISHYKIIVPVLVVFLGFLLQSKFQDWYKVNMKDKHNNKNAGTAFTSESLAKYNGDSKKKLYLAILGVIFDVSKSPQHYARGAPYHYFVGKDGSRGLVTGDFKDESANKDHVLDLPCSDILTLQQWRESLKRKYKKIGVLAGRYYDTNSKMTGYMLEFNKKLDACLLKKETDKQMDVKYPPCNIAWSEEEGTKVWCTKSSGGIHRSWEGVPRQLFIPGEDKPKCVCINTEKEHDISEGLLKEYTDCSNTSSMCYVISN